MKIPLIIADEPVRTGMGGVAIINGIFNNVIAIPTTFVQDAASIYAIPTGSNNGWYSYNSATNIISPSYLPETTKIPNWSAWAGKRFGVSGNVPGK